MTYELSPSSPTPKHVGTARRELIVLAVLSALAFALRLTSLSRSLFNDETVSLALAQRSFGHMFSLYGYEANGTPYSLVLWPTIRIFGTQEAVLRLPALIAGTLGIPAMYWAARAFTARRWVALLAAGLLAINPMAVWYSQVARSYAFVVLAACIAFGALVRWIDDPDRRTMFWLYVAGMVLLAYSDLFAPVLVLPAQALIVRRGGMREEGDGEPRERKRVDLQRWLTALVAVLVLCVPLLVAGLISHGRRDALYWLPKLSRGLVELALQEFSGGFSEVTAVRWLTLLALVVLVGAAAWLLRRREDGRARGTLLIALAWSVLPIALLLVVSAAYPVFWPRYAILALPGLCLLAALAAERLTRARAGLAIAGCCLVGLVAVGLYADAKQVDSVQQEWRPTMSWLHSARRADEPLVADSVLALPSMGYYDDQLRASDGDLIVQEWHDTPLPVNFTGYKDPTGYGRALNGPPSLAR
ncbi:MAG TPA: hypothetical protein VGI52_01455, partial [Solirubrobacteraceae bacterium]